MRYLLKIFAYWAWIKSFPKVTLYHHLYSNKTILCWIAACLIQPVLPMQRTISPESPVCMTERWLLQTSLHHLTNVVKKMFSTSTVRWRLCEAGIYSRVTVKKPLLMKQNNVKKFQWAKVHKNLTTKQWNKIVWSDEAKFTILRSNGLVGRVFANSPGDLGSIPGHVIPKTLKMVLDTSLLNTEQYKVRIKGKVEQSTERSSALP